MTTTFLYTLELIQGSLETQEDMLAGEFQENYGDWKNVPQNLKEIMIHISLAAEKIEKYLETTNDE